MRVRDCFTLTLGQSLFLCLNGGNSLKMSDIKLQKQMKRDFDRALRQDGELITIKYYIKKPTVTSDNWAQSDGVVWQYSDVLALKDTVSELTFGDANVANVMFSKTIFRFGYEGYDFHGNVKRHFQIIDANGQVYPIDKIVPKVRINQGFLCWEAWQK
jgi:hypothetical protein